MGICTVVHFLTDVSSDIIIMMFVMIFLKCIFLSLHLLRCWWTFKSGIADWKLWSCSRNMFMWKQNGWGHYFGNSWRARPPQSNTEKIFPTEQVQHWKGMRISVSWIWATSDVFILFYLNNVLTSIVVRKLDYFFLKNEFLL